MTEVIEKLNKALERAEIRTKADARAATAAISERYSTAPEGGAIREACVAIENVPGRGDLQVRVDAARRKIASVKNE